MEQCPECGSTNIIEDSGEVVCRNCGLVLGSIIDMGAEWRSYTPEEEAEKSRVGAPVTLKTHDKGLLTVIGDVNLDGRKRKMPESQRLKALKLRKWQRRSSTSTHEERNLSVALSEIGSLICKLNLPSSVYDEASLIYRRVLRSGLLKGRLICAFAAASAYIACRIIGVPRSIRDFAYVSGLRVKDVTRAYRLILTHLNINAPNEDPANYVKMIANKLDLPAEVERKAIEILRIARERRMLDGKSPRTIAAGAVYIMAKMFNLNVTQRSISEVVGITEVSVRNAYQYILKKIDVATLFGAASES